MIRISGPRSFEALDLLAGPGTASAAEPRKMLRPASSRPSGETLDDAIFVCFKNPESFTGEDVVELHIHGGGFTAARILEILAEAGVRQALPGILFPRSPKRKNEAFPGAGGCGSDQRINEDAVRSRSKNFRGPRIKLLTLSPRIFRKLSVLGEIGIDFADQDVDEVSLPHLKKRLLPAFVP